MDDNSTINLTILDHKIVVKEGTIVYIKHNKKCSNPCPITEQIISYLKAEMFISEGYILADTQIK